MKFFETLLSGLKAIILSHSYSKKESDERYVGKDNYVKIHQEQADWNEADSSSFAYIKNKPFEKTTVRDGLVIGVSGTIGGPGGSEITQYAQGHLMPNTLYSVEFQSQRFDVWSDGSYTVSLDFSYYDINNNEHMVRVWEEGSSGRMFIETEHSMYCSLSIYGDTIIANKLDSLYLPIANEDRAGILSLSDLNFPILNIVVGETTRDDIGEYYYYGEYKRDFTIRHESRDYRVMSKLLDRSSITCPGEWSYQCDVFGITEGQAFHLEIPYSYETGVLDFVLTPKLDIITPHETFIPIKDSVTDVQYYLFMENGKLGTQCLINAIEITTLPSKLSYAQGELFQPEGMVVVAYYADGSLGELPHYQWKNIPVLGSVLNLEYVQGKHTVKTSLSVNLTSPEDMLIDFEYTKNTDGTYTLTSWKGTLNGEPSTEMVVPNNVLFLI